MKHNHLYAAFALMTALQIGQLGGATKPADGLLPEDTLAVITFKDIKALEKAYENAPSSKLMKDPALQPFIKNTTEKFQNHFLKPLQEKTSIDLVKTFGLAEGQLTFALTQGKDFGNQLPGFVILVDVGSKKNEASQLLDQLRGQLSKNEVTFSEKKIQGSSFVEIGIPEEILPDPLAGKGLSTVWFGQSQSLLIMGTDGAALEKIVISNQGGNPPSLSQNANFKASLSSIDGSADSMGWFNFDPIIGFAKGMIESVPAPKEGPNPMAVFNALGINGLKAMSFYTRRESNGELNQFTLHVPKEQRQGIFAMLGGAAKPSGPLPFLPDEVASFSRSRLSLKDVFGGVEKMLAQISPEMSGLMTFMMAGIGKDQDKSYDFKRDFIGNLGDDIATIVLSAEGNDLEKIAQPPQMFLIGSSASDKLLYSAKILSGLVPNLEVQTNDFLGKKILSAELPTPDGSEMGIFITSHEGYLVVTQKRSMLEKFLRGNLGTGARKITGSSQFRRAVDKVGGTSTGLFGFDDPAKSLAPLITAVKNEPDLFQEIADNISGSISLTEEGAEESWIDFSLIPDASVITKYLEVTVYAGHLDNDGFKIKLYSPDPSGL